MLPSEDALAAESQAWGIETAAKRDGKATVFVVEDDPEIRNSLDMVLQAAHLPAEIFATAEDFLDGHTGQELGCLILDMHLPGMTGMDLLERLQSRPGHLPVIIFTGFGGVPTAVRSMQLGAVDFVEKPADPRVLVAKVRQALDQYHPRWRQQAEAQSAQARLAELSQREQELLQALIQGHSSKQIANRMGLSPRTVENHRARLLAKTGAENTADLVRLGILANSSRALTGRGAVGGLKAAPWVDAKARIPQP